MLNNVSEVVAWFEYWSDYTYKWRWYSNETFFSGTYTPFITAFLYVSTVKILEQIMKNVKKPIKPRKIMFVHNVILCLGSLAMFLGMSYEVVRIFLRDGPYVLYCDSMKQFHSRLCWWTYIFLFSKVYEFLDTIFMVLAKKEIIFLHIYHHAITLYVVWLCMDHKAPYGWILEITNTFIHVWMYGYYALSTFGYRPWWKNYLTIFQIVQFVLDLTGIIAWAWGKFVLGYECDGSVAAFALSSFVLLSFLALFIKFYRDAYLQKKRASAAAKSGAAKSAQTKKVKST